MELSHHANNVHLSRERGALVIPRLYENGAIPVEKSMIRLLQYIPYPFKRYHSLLEHIDYILKLIAPRNPLSTFTIYIEQDCQLSVEIANN